MIHVFGTVCKNANVNRVLSYVHANNRYTRMRSEQHCSIMPRTTLHIILIFPSNTEIMTGILVHVQKQDNNWISKAWTSLWNMSMRRNRKSNIASANLKRPNWRYQHSHRNSSRPTDYCGYADSIHDASTLLPANTNTSRCSQQTDPCVRPCPECLSSQYPQQQHCVSCMCVWNKSHTTGQSEYYNVWNVKSMRKLYILTVRWCDFLFQTLVK